MRSVLPSGGAPARYAPSHARPSRTPVVVTTAGLTLSLMPAVLSGTATHASAQSYLPAGPLVPVMTTIYSDVPVEADAWGNVSITALLVADEQGLPDGLFEVQADDGTGWKPVADVTAGADGKGVLILPVAVPQKVRIHFPADGLRSESFSKEWSVQPNAAARAALAEAARLAEQARLADVARQEKAAARTAAKPAAVPAVRASRSARAAAPPASNVPASGLAGAVLAEAAKHYGQAYRYGSTGPTTFDCSGFTSYVFRQVGLSLPRTSGAQQAATTKVPVGEKRPGDLIFTWTGGRVTHVGIYAGGNVMWAATKTGDIVRQQTIFSRNITVGRVI
ncbi:MAG: hypothetical protein JWL64_1861 [Frankiales bacterium]|nr:hypothetical protein [Frankiales bacterium]